MRSVSSLANFIVFGIMQEAASSSRYFHVQYLQLIISTASLVASDRRLLIRLDDLFSNISIINISGN